MAKTIAILVLTLLITCVVTVTVYAFPFIEQVNAAQAQNGDMTRSQSQLRQRDYSHSGEMTQTRERLQLRTCAQNSECTYGGPCACNQGDLETTNEETYQNRLCEETVVFTVNVVSTVSEDGISPGPAPGSGDGIPSGNQYIQPDTPGAGPAPNSGDGVPDGSGF
jgi:hypothetical protein